MRKSLVAGAALSAGLGVLASLGVASASTLKVDGGVLHYWELPAEVEQTPVPSAPAEPTTRQALTTFPAADDADLVPPPPSDSPGDAVVPAVDDVRSGEAPGDAPAEPGAPVEPPADDAAVTEAPDAED